MKNLKIIALISIAFFQSYLISGEMEKEKELKKL